MASFFRLKQINREASSSSLGSSIAMRHIEKENRQAYEELKQKTNEYIANSLIPAGAPDFAISQVSERWVLELVVHGSREELEPLAIFAKPYTAADFDNFYGQQELKSLNLNEGLWVKDDFFNVSFCMVLNVSHSTKNGANRDELFSYRKNTYSNRLSIEGYRLSQACGASDYRISLKGQDNLSMPHETIPGLESGQEINRVIEQSDRGLDIYIELPCGLPEGYNNFVVSEGYWRVYIAKDFPLSAVTDSGYSLEQIENALSAFVGYAFKNKTYTVDDTKNVPHCPIETLCR